MIAMDRSTDFLKRMINRHALMISIQFVSHIVGLPVLVPGTPHRRVVDVENCDVIRKANNIDSDNDTKHEDPRSNGAVQYR